VVTTAVVVFPEVAMVVVVFPVTTVVVAFPGVDSGVAMAADSVSRASVSESLPQTVT
jgi:hypothetical protein